MQSQLTPKPVSAPLPKLRVPTDPEIKLFEHCLEPLETVCRPPLDERQVLGYFNAMADLPPEAIFAAASEIVNSRVYKDWPMPGEIRAAAARMMSPALTAGEAWLIAHVAARQLADPMLDYHNGKPVKEHNDAIWGKLPMAVAITLRIFGGRNIGRTQQIYANFRDEYERQVAIVRRPLMLPAPVKPIVKALGQFKSVEY
jgi:hypothetical protein